MTQWSSASEAGITVCMSALGAARECTAAAGADPSQVSECTTADPSQVREYATADYCLAQMCTGSDPS